MLKIKLNIDGKTALVSGANRGIGKAIVKELIKRGATKVYAGARNIETLNELKNEYGNKIVPLELDLTKQETISKVASQINKLDILVNNAGKLSFGSLFSVDAVNSLKENMDVNVWGLLKLSNAVGKHFVNENPSAIINISSTAGLGNMPFGATYSVSKAAVHSITQGMRTEMTPNNTLVIGVYPGPVDTDMIASFEMEKENPTNVAKNIVDGIENGIEDVFPDKMSTQVSSLYKVNPKGVEQQFAAMV